MALHRYWWQCGSLRHEESEFVPASSDEEHSEAGLLNGPALDGQGVDQSDMDKLLNGDIEQLLAVAKDADEKGLGAGVDNLDDISASTEPQAGSLTDSSTGAPADPTDGIDFDAVPQSTAAAIEAVDDQVEVFAQDTEAETAVEGNDYSDLSE